MKTIIKPTRIQHCISSPFLTLNGRWKSSFDDVLVSKRQTPLLFLRLFSSFFIIFHLFFFFFLFFIVTWVRHRHGCLPWTTGMATAQARPASLLYLTGGKLLATGTAKLISSSESPPPHTHAHYLTSLFFLFFFLIKLIFLFFFKLYFYIIIIFFIWFISIIIVKIHLIFFFNYFILNWINFLNNLK